MKMVPMGRNLYLMVVGLLLIVAIVNAKLTIPMFDHHHEEASLTYVTSSKETFNKFTEQLLNSNVNNNHDQQHQEENNHHHGRGNIYSYASPSNGYYTESESLYHKTETMLLERKGDFVRTRSIARTMKRMSWKALWQLSKEKSTKSIKTQFGKTSSSSSDPMPPDHRRNWVPSFIGEAKIDGKPISWSYAPCFQNTSARITKIDAAKKSVTLEFETNGAVSYLCYDWYFITTRENYFVKILFTHGKHELILEHLNDDGEWDDVLQNGLRIFYFKDAIFQTVIDAFNAGKLLAGMYFEKDKMSFLKTNMGFQFNERPIKQIYLEDYELESGDVVMQLQLSGLDCLLMYGTGARTGHIASILKIDGVKYVVESTEEGVRRTPWKQWYNAAQVDSTIIIARLAPEYRKLYNESAAVELFKTLEGNQYGYVNIAYAWIDTEEDNYPHPLSGDMIGATFVLFNNWYAGSAINLLFLKGMNQRLQHYYGINANCTEVMCVFDYLTRLNITINYALTLPEKDGWLYDGKPMMVCSVMYMNLLKVSGIFGNLTNQIESGEFTPKDVYQLGIWDLNWRPEKCNVNDDDLPYCQVAGPWYWKLDNFSTIKPYAKMNERCGAEPMDYVRHPEFC